MFITALSTIATLWNQANYSSTNGEYQAMQNKPASENIIVFLCVEYKWEIKIQKISKYGKSKGISRVWRRTRQCNGEGEYSESALYAYMTKVTMKCINCITHAKEKYQNEKMYSFPFNVFHI